METSFLDPLIDFISFPISYPASFLPLPLDQAKLGILFLLAYPLGIIFQKLNDPKIRYIYGLVFGVYFQLTVFRENIFHTLFTAIVTYACAVAFGRKCVKPIVIFITVYSSAYHIYRMYSTPGVWRINIAFALMIDVCKFTAFAWAYQDGGKPKEEISADQEYRKIEALPSALEFFSYVYFYPSTLVGPFFDFKDYQNLIYKRGPFEAVPTSRACLWGLQSMAFGLLSALGDMLYSKKYNAAFTLTDEFAEMTLFNKLVYIYIAGYVMRLKYYSGFYMSQSGIDTSGLSYTGYIDGSHVFDRVMTCHRITEIASSARAALERWNASTQVWLKRYVYNRVLDRQRDLKQRQDPFVIVIVTFAVSAAWHGFYPSYYVTFFGIWSAVECSKSFYKAGRHRKLQWLPTRVAKFLNYWWTIFSINFLTIGHVNLELHKTIKSWLSVYCLPIVGNILMMIFLSVSGLAKTSKRSHVGETTTMDKAEVINEEKVDAELLNKYKADKKFDAKKERNSESAKKKQ